MLNRFKTALYNVVGSFDPSEGVSGSLGPGVTSGLPVPPGAPRGGLLSGSSKEKSVRFPYTRPHFLQLGSEDEIQVTADHAMRPIICPRDITRLPWNTGYAETINAGKSRVNEDQAMVHKGLLTRTVTLPPHSVSTPTTILSSTSPQSTKITQPLVNGHDGQDMGTQKAPTLTAPKSPPLSVSPAAELKEDFDNSSTSLLEQSITSDKLHSISNPTYSGDISCDKSTSDQPSDQTKSTEHNIDSSSQAAQSTDTAETPTQPSDPKSTSSDPKSSDTPQEDSQIQSPTTQKSTESTTTSDPLTTTTTSTTKTTTSDSSDTQPTTILLQPSSAPKPVSTTSQPNPTSSEPPTPTLPQPPSPTKGKPQTPTTTQPQQLPTVTVSLPYYVFGVFDGHAGWGAAVSAANQLHHLIHEKLCDVIDILIPDPHEERCRLPGPMWPPEREITIESAVTGALENAFWQMDNMIGEDRLRYTLSGGCTACVAVFIHGRLYVANAGDSRATLSYTGKPHPMSFDFTPETETQRIRKLGAMHPELLGGEFTHLDFIRRPLRRELGKRVMYRDHFMTGWAYKTLTPDDLKYPLVCGEGKRSRVLATIGVTRGFGDHDLKAQCTSIPIKPFLTPEPEVRTFDVMGNDLSDGDVLILATDGLWDITTNERAVATVAHSLGHFPLLDQNKHKYRYTSAAQDLVMASRGKLRDRNWRTSDDKHATIDDISVFVIPLKPYKEIHKAWLARQEAGWDQESVINGATDSTDFTKEYRSLNAMGGLMPAGGLKQAGESCDLRPQEDYFKSESLEDAQTQKQQSQYHSDQPIDAT